MGQGRTLFYTDDVLWYCQGRVQEQIAGELQTELHCIGRWRDEVGAGVNPTKTSLTWLSLNNCTVNTILTVNLC